jgi:hypothetical protein
LQVFDRLLYGKLRSLWTGYFGAGKVFVHGSGLVNLLQDTWMMFNNFD